MSLETPNKNIPLNPLMKIPAIPTFGIFDTSTYLLFQQIHVIKSQNIMPNNLPINIINQIKILSEKYPSIIPEFYHITLNANEIYTEYNERNIESNLLRINLVAHPYIFNNSNFSKSAKTHMNCVIYKSPDELDAINESFEEENRIKINPNCDMISPELNREIILRINSENNKMLLEPNNCAFLLNLNCRIVNFYCVVIGTHNNLPTKCFIGNYVIITNALKKSILNSFTQKLINYTNIKQLISSILLNQMLYNDSFMFIIFYILNKIVNESKNKIWTIEEIKNLFYNGFKVFFEFEYDKNKTMQKEHEIDLNNICNYYFTHIKNFINYLYEGSNCIPEFSEKMLLCNIKNKYILELLRKYIDFHLSLIHNTFYSYLGYFSEEIDIKEIKEEVKNIHKKEIWPKYKEHFCKELKISLKDFDKIIISFVDKNWKKVENKNIGLLVEVCEAINNGKQIETIFEKIDEPIKEYFYYYIWVYKGRLRGVHKNFGKLSFFCSDKLKKIYHCNQKEKLDCCDKMAQVIIQADSQYNQLIDN